MADRKVIYRNYASRQILENISDEERIERIESAVAEALDGFFQ